MSLKEQNNFEMSRPILSRSDRVAQMSKQEELIAKKRQEFLEKQRTTELAKAVAAAQNNVSGNDSNKTEIKPDITSDHKLKPQNNFCNDGSFLTHFKKILDSAKKENEEKCEKNGSAELSGSGSSSIKSDIEGTDANEKENDVLEDIECTAVNVMATEQFSPPPLTPIATNTASEPSPDLSHPPPAPQSVFYPPHSVPVVKSTINCGYAGHPNISDSNLPVPHSVIPAQSKSFPHPPFFDPSIPPPILSTPAPPPPPPPPPTAMPVFLIPPPEIQLNSIPPPEPLQLSNIPPPKELDLNAIPNPEMNLDAIKIPEKNTDNNEQFLPTTLESLIELVAHKGDAYEDNIRTRKNDVHPSLWFLFDKESDPYMNFRRQVLACRQIRWSKVERISDEIYDPESVCEYQEDSDDEYMKDMMDRNLDNLKRKIDNREESEFSDDDRDSEQNSNRQRKRKSRWGGKVDQTPQNLAAVVQTTFGNQNKPILSAIQRTDPALLQYARQNYGTTNLTEDDWRKCEEHFKVNLLYQDMMRKREEIDRLAKGGKFKYEYDSDEDTAGGTWEHKLRTAEMEATQAWADALTEQSEGKHHIGDFLPPEELKKFMEKYDAKKNNRQPDLSDYKEYKLKEDNIGFQMLQKLGWKEGQGLGASGEGIVDPVNKASQREANQGLGAGTSSNPDECDNEYEAYRKRMMLAYRFRPNPLNNPRRAYY